MRRSGTGSTAAPDSRSAIPADPATISSRRVAQASADRLEHLRPGRETGPRLGREVRAPVERRLVGGEEHVQRPAAVSGHRLHRVHVDRVDVGPLLTVDLHAHEALVHERRGALVLEGLVLHHVAPMAGRVADRDEDRPVLRARPGEGGLAPRMPVDRIVAVLAQIRRRLGGESVGHDRSSLTGWRRWPRPDRGARRSRDDRAPARRRQRPVAARPRAPAATVTLK